MQNNDDNDGGKNDKTKGFEWRQSPPHTTIIHQGVMIVTIIFGAFEIFSTKQLNYSRRYYLNKCNMPYAIAVD